ncbi:MAG: FKBP-type peptidyl-prolyl cis-trans isomerase [Chitinophagales bacterium]|nr:FKBP-type peptidyl-prolyl cis-trans isomerase [Chitinophagales bacterium]
MRSRIIPFLFLPLFISLYSCSSENKATDKDQKVQPEKAEHKEVNEDETILQLSYYLIGDAATLADQEQNTIVNYAIDNLIPLERTNSGLFYRILQEGEGEQLEWGDYVSAHYKGYYMDSKVFDSSYKRDKPMNFYIGNMVPGWNEGLQLIKPGGKMQLFVPSALGYGEKGLGNEEDGYLVPPNSILVFDLEVLEILKKKEE